MTSEPFRKRTTAHAEVALTRIPRAVIDEVDALVARLDADTSDEPFTVPATSS